MYSGSSMKAIYFLIVVWMLIYHVQPSNAVREGAANAQVMIQRYEREGDFAKAALWHEAAADCLKIISTPMTEIQIRYYLRHGRNVQAERSRGELAAIKKRRGIPSEGCEGTLEKIENGEDFSRTGCGTREDYAVYLNMGTDLSEPILPLRYLPQFLQKGTGDFQKDGELCRCP